MNVRDLLAERVLGNWEAAVFDKIPGEPAYVIGNAAEVRFAQLFIRHRRVDVPIDYDYAKYPDVLTLRLIREVAGSQPSLTYDPSFKAVRARFEALALPFAAVLKNPATAIEVPADVDLVKHEEVPENRFFCLTSPDHLGVSPVRNPGTVTFDAQNQPVSLAQRGYCIYNPSGVIPVLVQAKAGPT